MSIPLRKGIFLVASPKLRDPNFSQTVVLLCEHNDQGSLGVVVNRPTNLRLSDALPSVKTERAASEVIFAGGPVQPDQLMTLYRATHEIPDAQHIHDGMYLGGTLSILEQVIASPSSNTVVRAYVGYAGWGPTQLESELREEAWITVPSESKFVFNVDPSQVWSKILASLGDQYRIYAMMPPDPSLN